MPFFVGSTLPHGASVPSGPAPSHYRHFTITLRHDTLSRTLLDEWSARRKDLYLTTDNTHNRQTSVPPAGFEPAIPVSQQLQTHTLDSAANGMGPLFCLFLARQPPQSARASSFTTFLYHTQRRTIVSRTPLDKLSCRRDLYLTTDSNHNRKTSMPPLGFELTISADERPQTYALNCTTTGTDGPLFVIWPNLFRSKINSIWCQARVFWLTLYTEDINV